MHKFDNFVMKLYMFRTVRLPGPARKLTSNRMTYTSAKCTVNELLMTGRGTARNT